MEPVAIASVFYRLYDNGKKTEFGTLCYELSDGTLRRYDMLTLWVPTNNDVLEARLEFGASAIRTKGRHA